MRIGRADHDGSAFRRLRVALCAGRENDSHRRDAQVGKLIGVRERIAAEVDGEAVLVRFLDCFAITKVGKHVVMRIGEAAPAFVCFDNEAQRNAIDGDLVVAHQIASDIVAPKRTGFEGAYDVEELVEAIDASAVRKRVASRGPIEESPDIAAECAILCVTKSSQGTVTALLERARLRTSKARAGRDHDWASNRICSYASDQKFVHCASPAWDFERPQRIAEICGDESNLVGGKAVVS